MNIDRIEAKPFGNGIDVCPVCGKPSTIGKPTTNGDRIRTMTDEELAEHLFRHICNWSCPPHKEYIKSSCGGEKPDCKKCWLDWLKQEVDDGRNV